MLTHGQTYIITGTVVRVNVSPRVSLYEVKVRAMPSNVMTPDSSYCGSYEVKLLLLPTPSIIPFVTALR